MTMKNNIMKCIKRTSIDCKQLYLVTVSIKCIFWKENTIECRKVVMNSHIWHLFSSIHGHSRAAFYEWYNFVIQVQRCFKRTIIKIIPSVEITLKGKFVTDQSIKATIALLKPRIYADYMQCSCREDSLFTHPAPMVTRPRTHSIFTISQPLVDIVFHDCDCCFNNVYFLLPGWWSDMLKAAVFFSTGYCSRDLSPWVLEIIPMNVLLYVRWLLLSCVMYIFFGCPWLRFSPHVSLPYKLCWVFMWFQAMASFRNILITKNPAKSNYNYPVV